MKISLADSLSMFALAGVDRTILHQVLRNLAPTQLKPKMRSDWSPDNPTRNFCYVVSEWLLTRKAPTGSVAFSLMVPGDTAKHYFLRWPLGEIVDLTAEQFPDYSLLDYSLAKKTSFMFSPSRRANELADAYTFAEFVLHKAHIRDSVSKVG